MLVGTPPVEVKERLLVGDVGLWEMLVEFERRKDCMVKLLEIPLVALATQETGMAGLLGATTRPTSHSSAIRLAEEGVKISRRRSVANSMIMDELKANHLNRKMKKRTTSIRSRRSTNRLRRQK